MSKATLTLLPLVLAGALAASACGSDTAGEPEAGTATAPAETETEAAETETQEPTTTEEEATPPVTEAERKWLRKVARYHAKLQREQRRGGTVTQGSLNRDAALYAECATTLAEAGDPGRFAPAAKRAQRACERLTKASKAAAEARDAVGPGGGVVVGTPEEKIFERAFGQANEAAANGEYGLARAVEQAKQIQRRIERAQ